MDSKQASIRTLSVIEASEIIEATIEATKHPIIMQTTKYRREQAAHHRSEQHRSEQPSEQPSDHPSKK